MKHTIVSLALLLSLLTATSAFAWDNGGVDAKIVSVVALMDGQFYVHSDTDICDNGDNKVGYVYKGVTAGGVTWSQEGAVMMLKTALSAKLSGSTVRIYADDSGSRWGCLMGAIMLK